MHYTHPAYTKIYIYIYIYRNLHNYFFVSHNFLRAEAKQKIRFKLQTILFYIIDIGCVTEAFEQREGSLHTAQCAL